MPDPISLMLDSMITAVEDGFSYDGIVSIPETGLEDVQWYRPGTSTPYSQRQPKPDDAIPEQPPTTSAAIPPSSHTPVEPPPDGDESSSTDPEIAPCKPPRKREPHPQGPLPGESDEPVGEKLPRKQAREENEVGAQETLPRKRDERIPDDDQNLPREQGAQILEDNARPDGRRSLPTPENEVDANRPPNIEPERHPRKIWREPEG